MRQTTAHDLLDELVGREERRNLVEAGEGFVLVEEAALGEAGDESGEALVVGERVPDGPERRADPHPRAHQPPVLLPRQLPHLHLETVPLVPVLLHLPAGDNKNKRSVVKPVKICIGGCLPQREILLTLLQ